MILAFGAFLGFTSVAFGAYAEHGLRASVAEEDFRFLMTAVRYCQVHAVVISAVGLVLLSDGKLAKSRTLKWSGALFIIGTTLFSFSIILSVWFNIPDLVKITPTGGATIMAAWLLLLAAGVIARKKDEQRTSPHIAKDESGPEKSGNKDQ